MTANLEPCYKVHQRNSLCGTGMTIVLILAILCKTIAKLFKIIAISFVMDLLSQKT
jgi:hypothetical protein